MSAWYSYSSGAEVTCSASPRPTRAHSPIVGHNAADGPVPCSPPAKRPHQNAHAPRNAAALPNRTCRQPNGLLAPLTITLLPRAMCSIECSQLLKHPILSACGDKATHGFIALPVITECGAACSFDVFLLLRTSKMNLFSEKTVCFDFSTGNSSAQSILNLKPSSFHYGLSKCHDHIPGHTTFVL